MISSTPCRLPQNSRKMLNVIFQIKNHALFQTLFNPSYRAFQPFEDYWNYGSRNHFETDLSINGEYFRSRTNNQYFCVVDKNALKVLKNIDHYICDFRELEQAIKIRNYNPQKHALLRLEFKPYKSYFVESYQAITVKEPDFTVVDIPLEELRLITPKFIPI